MCWWQQVAEFLRKVWRVKELGRYLDFSIGIKNSSWLFIYTGWSARLNEVKKSDKLFPKPPNSSTPTKTPGSKSSLVTAEDMCST